jgi:RNA polymerase sigma-70 factor (ECF subfamily)
VAKAGNSVTKLAHAEVLNSVKEDGDEVLVRRVLAGETQVYARLVERYRDGLGRYALRMLGNSADAEDAIQDTFVRGYRSLARCRPADFRFWLFGILANRCRTYAARRARSDEVMNSALLLASATNPWSNDDPDGWRQTIGWAMAQLPPDQREAFLLKHVEDLSYDEMQELTGVRVPALKMRVFRAREALRRLLEEKVLG